MVSDFHETFTVTTTLFHNENLGEIVEKCYLFLTFVVASVPFNERETTLLGLTFEEKKVQTVISPKRFHAVLMPS